MGALTTPAYKGKRKNGPNRASDRGYSRSYNEGHSHCQNCSPEPLGVGRNTPTSLFCHLMPVQSIGQIQPETRGPGHRAGQREVEWSRKCHRGGQVTPAGQQDGMPPLLESRSWVDKATGLCSDQHRPYMVPTLGLLPRASPDPGVASAPAQPSQASSHLSATLRRP